MVNFRASFSRNVSENTRTCVYSLRSTITNVVNIFMCPKTHSRDRFLVSKRHLCLLLVKTVGKSPHLTFLAASLNVVQSSGDGVTLIFLAWLGLGVDSLPANIIVFVYQHVISSRTQFCRLTGVSCVFAAPGCTVSFAGDFVHFILPSSLGNSFTGSCLAMLGCSLVAWSVVFLLLQAVLCPLQFLPVPTPSLVLTQFKLN